MRRFPGFGLSLALVLAVISLTACSTSAPPPPTSRIPVDERPFVVDPATGYLEPVEPIHMEAVRSAFADLGLGIGPSDVAAAARGVLAAAPDHPPATVLLAQTEFLAGRTRQAIEWVEPVVEQHPDYLAAGLLLSRSLERVGEIDLAYERYRHLAPRSDVAAQRASALRERAREIVARRFEDALARGRLDPARKHLDRLATWVIVEAGLDAEVTDGDPESLDPETAPEAGGAAEVEAEVEADADGTPAEVGRAPGPVDLATRSLGTDVVPSADQVWLLDAESRLLAARGDRVAELAVLDRLTRFEPSADRLWRLGELELEVGDVRAGLGVFERLSSERAESLGAERLLELPDRLAAAQFLWKIELLPPEVRTVSRRAELDRADLATLLYWLLPGVRFAEVEDAPIAGDILDHPQRREVLVILDQGLMGIDRSRHRFRPTDAATRQTALAAILTFLQTGDDTAAACLEGEPRRSAEDRQRPWVCANAARCGLIADPLDCLPAARLSGREALDLIRHGLETLEPSAGS